MVWTAVVLTCSDPSAVDVYQNELKIRQVDGTISRETHCLVIEDPVAGIGSGGATLNALLYVTEYLSSIAGLSVVTSDVLHSARIVIFHVSRQYLFNSTGRALLSLPSDGKNETSTVLDHLLSTVTTISNGCKPGVWVCSTDMLLTIPPDFSIDWTAENDSDVLTFSVQGDVVSAQRHGVFISNSQGFVTDILYKGSSEALSQYCDSAGRVDLVVCLVYFNLKSAEKLLSFHTLSPLNSCTYLGVDSGAEPIKVSLFFDLLYAICCKDSPITIKTPAKHYQIKWKLLTNILRGLTLKRVLINDGRYDYLFNEVLEYKKTIQYSLSKLQHTDTKQCGVNSIITQVGTSNCYIANSHIGDRVLLHNDCIIINSDLSNHTAEIGPGIIYQQIRMNKNGEDFIVPVIYHSDDSMKVTEDSCLCGVKWSDLMKILSCNGTDLWNSEIEYSDRTLMNAKLYSVIPRNSYNQINQSDLLFWMQDMQSASQHVKEKWLASERMSLTEILIHVDPEAEMLWRRSLFVERCKLKVQSVLMKQEGFGLISMYQKICIESRNRCGEILETLDQVAIESNNAGIAARSLANIADVLGCMARGRGGLRSGPAANVAWQQAYNQLEKGETAGSIRSLAALRSKWMDRADHMIRAARHYEGAAQILIRLAVMTARQFMKLSPTSNLIPINVWLVGETPARADIAGGWSDTPPISYEHGGVVTNVSILVDSKKPIGCKVRRIKEFKLVLVMQSGSDFTTIEIKELQQLADYFQPQTPGALLKAAFCCAEIINLESSQSLSEQLECQYQSGFELRTWSNLPHGSGLGTSSILAGCIMGTLWRACGQNYNDESLIHSVLHLEQMLTTGGGWQDQVGGLLPGFKIGESQPKLPLYVTYRTLKVPDDTLKQFNERFLLVYTGKTRLARNLLQNVIRNWYARDPDIVQTEDSLVMIAQQCADAMEQGDLNRVADLWNEYWRLKKLMATGCEPQAVTRMISALKHITLCACMAGAGGGGFLYLLTKEPNKRKEVEETLKSLQLAEKYSVHDGSVCTEGLSFYQLDN